MIRYEKYKNSSIEWLGLIPSHWQLLRVKDIGKVILGKMLNNTAQVGYEYKHYLKSKNINWLNVNIDSVEEMYFSKHEMKQYRIKKDDLLLSEGGEVGKTCIWNDEVNECYIQNSVHKITTFKNKDPRYYLYLSFSLGSSKYYDKIVNQVSIKHLTWEKLIKVIWLVPPIEEQTIIAQYLDTKTQAIDKKVNLLTKKAEYYKELRKSIINNAVCKGLDKNVELKNSGIYYINSVPVHWKIERIKDQFYIGRGRVIGQEVLVENGKYPVYSSQTENNGCLGFISTYDFDKDLLTWTTDGANAGTVFRRKGKFNCTNVCGTLIPKKKNLDLNYVVYALQESATHNKRIDTNGAKIMNNEMAVIHIAFPPLAEQTAIATYLDEKTQKIDAIVTNIGKQIETLKELRKTLINDVVTGKIKVVK
jgi:type I restriction enzyme S subunit